MLSQIAYRPSQIKTNRKFYRRKELDNMFGHKHIRPWGMAVYCPYFRSRVDRTNVHQESTTRSAQIKLISLSNLWYRRLTLSTLCHRLSTLLSVVLLMPGTMRQWCTLPNMTQHLKGEEWFIEAINTTMTFFSQQCKFCEQKSPYLTICRSHPPVNSDITEVSGRCRKYF